MEIKTCNKCRRIFENLSGIPGVLVCPSCSKVLDEKFKQVRHFLRENNGASMYEVAEVCEVEIPQIKQWIREERLYLMEESKITIDCEICGKPTKTGRYCLKCKGTVIKDLKAVYKQPEPEAEPNVYEEQRIHFLKQKKTNEMSK
ncbi:MAG: flagellar protein [Vallitaleaceae bacterium]|nr:flagellar protein [Vallitaleaceae bacterium]